MGRSLAGGRRRLNPIVAIIVAVILGILALKLIGGIIKFVVIAAIVVGIAALLMKKAR